MPHTEQQADHAMLNHSEMELLEEKRQAILIQLDFIKRQEEGDTTMKKTLQTQYNEIMNKMESHISINAVNFIETLPAELAIVCIQESLPEGDHTRRLLDLSTLSTQWMEFIVSSKPLWAHINVRKSQEDAIATIALSLHLSGHMPLFLTIWNDPSNEWDVISPLLQLHQQRIHSIDLRQEDRQTDFLRFSIARNILQSFNDLKPSTEVQMGEYSSLRLDLSQIKELTSASKACVLRGVDTLLTSIPPQDHKVLHQFGSIITEDAVGQVYPLLGSMTNLKSIWFRPTSLQVQPTISTNRLGIPHCLTSLTCFQAFDEHVSTLLLLVGHNLRHLSLTISPFQRGQLLQCLTSARYLKELSIEVKGSAATQNFINHSASMSPIWSLKKLSLQGQAWEESDTAVQPDYAPLNYFIRDFTVLYPGVVSFRMESFDLETNFEGLRLFLEPLKSLESLKMWGASGEPGLDALPWSLRSLKKLDIEQNLVAYIDVAENCR